MKFTAIITLAATALAAPSMEAPSTTVKRQDIKTVTDQLLFSVTLPQFESRRNARDPASLDWSSDGCTSSPDNPFGFPYVPACHRHDFGYQNYRAQSRFTKDAKARIDSNFKKDLYYQCQGVSAKTACERLADVYYAAVKEFGGDDATKRGEELSYAEAVEAYNEAVKEAQEQGLLPAY